MTHQYQYQNLVSHIILKINFDILHKNTYFSLKACEKFKIIIIIRNTCRKLRNENIEDNDDDVKLLKWFLYYKIMT